MKLKFSCVTLWLVLFLATPLSLKAFYDPGLQRWLNRDPIGELGGLNLYGYVGNDSINWIDPFGLEKGAELLMRLNNAYGGLNSLPGKIWNSPNTAVGLVWGGLGVPFGAKPNFGNNALQFEDRPFMHAGNITFGNVICYDKDTPPKRPDPENPPYTFGEHEYPHTTQSEQLGPFFLPVYAIFGMSSFLHGGEFFGHGNYMEEGPNSQPPRPWP